jgi:hypothetical protein
MSDSAEAARAALDVFLAAWNAADNAALQRAVNYPFVTVGPAGQTHVAAKPEEFTTNFDRLRQTEGWASTTWDGFHVVSAGEAKVHCVVDYTRYHADGAPYLRGRILYIVTDHGGHWGMQYRSTITQIPVEPSR